MPFDMLPLLREILPGIADFGDPGGLQIYPVGGGSINNAFQVLTKENKRWFGKFNEVDKFPDLFVKEDRGLALLRRQNIIRIPHVIACTIVGKYQLLLLEWIEEGSRSANFRRTFGEQLARLHRVTADSFGLDEDNYMGALPQDNTPKFTWTEFFIHQRLEPLMRQATDQGLLDKTTIRHFERLYPILPSLFPIEPPSLLHGDLWSGNFLCDPVGNPVLIDPAVYYGHRSMDLAMTTLFGGLDRVFYEAYAASYPLPANYREQWDICNLYPLLIHLILFGKSYQPAILRTIQRF